MAASCPIVVYSLVALIANTTVPFEPLGSEPLSM